MRTLGMKDVFAACRLLSVIGVREEIRAVAKEAEDNKGKRIQFDFGFDLLFGIIEKASQQKAEVEIYKFIADLLECEWEDVRDGDPIKTFNKLQEVANVEEWKAFFKQLGALMKKK